MRRLSRGVLWWGRQAAKKNLMDLEAEEEEEEDMLKGLEDFGFGAVSKAGAAAAGGGKGGEEDNEDVEVRDDDFENIVDEVSDGEGDEDAGREYALQKARRDTRLTRPPVGSRKGLAADGRYRADGPCLSLSVCGRSWRRTRST